MPTLVIPTAVPLPTGIPTAAPVCFVTTGAPIAFMQDNYKILLKTDAGVQIFNLKTLKEEKFLPAPQKLGQAVALFPDGDTLAWTFEDNTVQTIRLYNNKLLHTLAGNTGSITKLKFSPSGDKLFSASHSTWVKGWDQNGNPLNGFRPSGADNLPSDVLGMGFSPDGKKLATIPFDGPVKIWSLANYKLIREMGGSGGFDTSDAAFSPDGQLLAANLATGLFLWKTTDGSQLSGGNPAVNSMAVAFSPNGRLLAYSQVGEKYSIVLSTPDGTHIVRTLEGQSAPVWKLLFSPDSSLLVSVDDMEIGFWRVDDGKLLMVGKSECP